METCMGAVWAVSPFSVCFKESRAGFEEGRGETLGVAKTSRAISWLVGCQDVEFPTTLALELEESVTAGSVPSATAISCAARRLSRFWTAVDIDVPCPVFWREVRYILKAAGDFSSGEAGSYEKLILCENVQAKRLELTNSHIFSQRVMINSWEDLRFVASNASKSANCLAISWGWTLASASSLVICATTRGVGAATGLVREKIEPRESIRRLHGWYRKRGFRPWKTSDPGILWTWGNKLEKKRVLDARKSLGGLARAAEARNTPDNLERSDYNIRQDWEQLTREFRSIP